MLDKLATVGSGQAFVHFAQKPLIVIDHALDRFYHKSAAVAALLGGELAKLRFEVIGKMNFHVPSVGSAGAGVKHGDGPAAFQSSSAGSASMMQISPSPSS